MPVGIVNTYQDYPALGVEKGADGFFQLKDHFILCDRNSVVFQFKGERLIVIDLISLDKKRAAAGLCLVVLFHGGESSY